MYGAKKASDASKDAAGMQIGAANRAAELLADTQRESLGFQRDVYNQGRADQQPWIQAGRGSVNKLAHLMGIGGMGGGGGFQPLQASSGGSRTPGLPSSEGMFVGGSKPLEGPMGAGPRGTYRWPGAEPNAFDQAQQREDFREERQAYRQSRPGFVPRRPQPSRTVQMQAPDGSVEAVPMHEVEMMEQAGAVRV